jgi:hypothetical protein
MPWQIEDKAVIARGGKAPGSRRPTVCAGTEPVDKQDVSVALTGLEDPGLASAHR